MKEETHLEGGITNMDKLIYFTDMRQSLVCVGGGGGGGDGGGEGEGVLDLGTCRAKHHAVGGAFPRPA